MEWRDATEEEAATFKGATPPAPSGGFRDATPEELVAFANTPTVRPGDVEARKRQVAAQAAAEAPNVVRPRETILGNLEEGYTRFAKNLPLALSRQNKLDPNAGLLESFLSHPFIQAALGASQVAGAPLAPLTNLAARGGEAASQALQEKGFTTGADIAGAVTEAATNVLPQVATGKIVDKFVKPLAASSFAKSNRAKAATSVTEAEAALAAASDQATARTAGIGAARTAAETRAQQALAATEKSTAEAVSGAKGSAQAATESYQSIGEAAKGAIPTRADLKKIAGETLGETTGADFSKRYHAERTARKAASDDLYEAALGPAEEGAKPVAAVYKDAQEQGVSLQKAIGAAATPQEKDAAQKSLADFINGVVPEEEVTIRQLHEGLINVREGKRAAQFAKRDNLARLAGDKEKTIMAKIEEVQPGTLDSLAKADSNYAENYVPYFGRRSPTRAIVEKNPAAIAESIILPHSRSGREVDTLNRAFELIGNDPKLKRQVAQAHLNQGIDEASKGKDFREGFTKWWDKYTNPSGNNNKVLRTAYGKEYDDVNAVVNQFKSSKPKDIDGVVATLVGGATTKVSEAEKAAKVAMGLAQKESTGAISAAAQGEKAALAGAKESHKAEVAAIRAKLERDIMKFLPESKVEKGLNVVSGGGNVLSKRIQSIGAGVFVSGALRGNAHTASVGGIMALGSQAAGTLMNSVRGRSLLKAILRGTPGTVQAAATARMTERFLKEAEANVNE